MNIPDNWFKDWFNSPYYHQLYFERDDQEATIFINRLIEYLHPDGDSFMMDAGCGKGRHAIILASLGFDITGIDLSFENIGEAKTHETDKLHFFQHDLRLPFWINYFNYTFNLFTSFGYFKTEREHYNAIRTIANSIKLNGVLVFDYLNVPYTEDHLDHKVDKQVDGVKFYLTKWHDETHFYKKIIVEDESLKEPLIFQEKVAKFTLGNFSDMFALHNLQLQEVFGDYDLKGYDLKNSPRMLMIAKKV
jgi:2-polyprenyl-3-methyl-5-hydroxy-6-metoxy-1,4-benzoquinol methylase